ncbi:MAG: ribbon-helix-helix protein, CopG family [Actinomycetota bacterium]|nr:ribbon-helix-helix protein, CopG family [Actinomycetota bacterium]
MDTGTRTTTVRMPSATAEALEVVARADNQSVSEAVRLAIEEHIEARRGDRAFRERLDALFEADREVFERLAKL